LDIRTGEETSPPTSESEPTFEIKVDGNSILVKKRSTNTEKKEQPRQQGPPSIPSSEYEFSLLDKQKFEDTDVMSFKFRKQQHGKEADGVQNPFFDYTAGQYAFFNIGGIYNDSKGPIRHFTISSS